MSETREPAIASRHSVSGSREELRSPSAARGAVSGHDVEDDEILHLVQRIFLGHAERPPQVVAFTSVDPDGGSMQVCVSVAKALTKILPGSVCLVEANFREPSLASHFGLPSNRGLRDALAENAPVASFAHELTSGKLCLLPAGSGPIAPGVLGTDAFRARIMQLKNDFEVILIDCSSMNQAADAISIGRWADGLILVLEANATRREEAVEATQMLRGAGVKILAAVLNNRVSAIPTFLDRRL